MIELANGRIQIKPVIVQKKDGTSAIESHELFVDGHLLGLTKLECDARLHGYALEKSLAQQPMDSETRSNLEWEGGHGS